MYPFNLLSLALIALALSTSSALFHKDVTPKNFDALIDPSKASILLEFYAPWCGHCKSLAPEYEKLGAAFQNTPNVVVAQVDADAHKSLASRFGIKGFPTLKWIQKGSEVSDAQDVDAGRTAEDLLQYINSKTGLSKKLSSGPPSAVVDVSTANFKDIVLGEKTSVLVGFFAPWCGHCKALKPAWEKLAHLYADDNNVIIASVNCDENSELATAYEVKGFPTIKYFGPGQAIPDDYAGGRDLEAFVQFVNEKTGLDLSADGGVTPQAGVVAEIADHVKTFLSAETDEERTAAMNTCHEKVETLDEKAKTNFKYYLKVFQRIGEKGASYVSTERERLSKMLKSPQSLKSSQLRNFMRRVNVLNAFEEL